MCSFKRNASLFTKHFSDDKSSCPDVFFKKCVSQNFAKFTGKHLCQSLFFNKVAGCARVPFLIKWQSLGLQLYYSKVPNKPRPPPLPAVIRTPRLLIFGFSSLQVSLQKKLNSVKLTLYSKLN